MTGKAAPDRGRHRALTGARLLLLVVVVVVVVVVVWSLVPQPVGEPETEPVADAPSATELPEPTPLRRRVAPAAPEPPGEEEPLSTAVAEAFEGSAPEGAAEIRVTDDAGEAVADVSIVLVHPGRVEMGTSDEWGVARVLRPPGTVTMRVVVTGSRVDRYLPVPQLELAEEDPLPDVELVTGAPVRGRVVAPDGEPLRSVYLDCVERPSGRRLPPVLTDDAGRFVALVRVDGSLDLRLDGVARMALAKSGGTMQQMELPWWGRWTGLAPDPDEQLLRAVALPRRDVQVTVFTPDGGPVEGVRIRWSLGRWSPFAGAVTTDVDGRATFSDLPARARTVRVELSEDTPWVAPEPGAIDADDTNVRIELIRAARIAGRVVRADGGAVTWCGIDVLHGDETIASGTSDDDGRFDVALPEDAPAPLRLAARFYARDGTRREGAVEGVWPGTTGVEIVVDVVD